MITMHRYPARVLADLKRRVPWEAEFLQAVEEVFTALSPALAMDPVYEGEQILERIIEPERVLGFRVVWQDDRGRMNVNRGYRVQFNSALGPYKGGLRFHPSVSLSGLKFLGFEQTFKNALTGIAMGGGKGGSDFQPKGRSDAEIMRFCQSFMTELHRHIGPDTDVPAGDIGVGAREIGYLFGQYKRLSNTFSGALTGKGLNWGGSLMRPEATGFGATYFAQEMLKRNGEEMAGKRVAVSGFGNVAWGVVQKVNELGGKVVTLSGPDGFIYDPDGVTDEKVDYMVRMRIGTRDEVRMYAEEFDVDFFPKARPWQVPCDVAFPCAIQNELELADAENLIKNGCRYVVEGANMPTTNEAVAALQAAGVHFAPGKAANAGGVATSGLEMAQNSARMSWTAEEVDASLRRIMTRIHEICVNAGDRYGHPGDYVVGANIGGFLRVAEAMIDQGAV